MTGETRFEGRRLLMDGVTLSLDRDDGPHPFLMKSRRAIERYLDLAGTMRSPNLVEVGIFRGGSTIFLDRAFRPRRLFACDRRKDEGNRLEEFVAAHRREDVIKAVYGVNQARIQRIVPELLEWMQGAPIDMMIDDASHRLDLTKHTFNTLFPLLRPHGAYVIEDWGWANYGRGVGVESWRDRPGLNNLIFELTMLAASAPEIVEEITLVRELAIVRKGPADLDAAGFDLSQHYHSRGKRLELI